MNLAWKEMKRNKVRFLILGSIIFLISLLTFIISGLANGLSQDNASLINDLPEGHFYMSKDANQTYNLSQIEPDIQESLITKQSDTIALAIQMGFVHDPHNKQQSVAFVAATDSPIFDEVEAGEVILDSSMKEKGLKIGDIVTNTQLSGDLVVKGFVKHKKFSHAPVALINIEDYKEMYRVDKMQFIFIPGEQSSEKFNGYESFSKREFLQTIPSYNAEQMSLNMIVWFLVIISGMLFAIFFYMMNVQKIGLYGILKAIGLKTSKLFNMMWTQMMLITSSSLVCSIAASQLFNEIAPVEMPFRLTMSTTIQLSLVFFFIGFIGATLSGIQIKKIQPLQAIQQGEI
ncbi:putative ABC transport system permease protein [Ureibacillus xyleni]|uniref:Putative hemin transport system permease protein HrtB n=1 Tax=Ureibacillus xyleni TaxID=614648 RepID=A0A285SJN3_9BACL|nr:ABC transporter permease [Ureibacillus xyleni]SOC06164.1 putative ABC transport system permease protein [Ureibacillus xyleni]